MVRHGAVTPACGQAVRAPRSPTCGAACAATAISVPASSTAMAASSLPRAAALIVRPRRSSTRSSSSEPSSSERNLVIEVAALAAGAGHGGLARRARTRGAELAPAGFVAAEVTAATATGTVQHGELRIEALQHDLGGIAILARLILPFAGLQGAFEIDLGALLQILLGDLAEPLVEDDHAVPLGLFLALSGRLVAPAFGGGHPQIRDRPAVLGTPDFRIRTEIADQDDLVH